VALSNWAGNYTYRALTVHAPASLEELAELVARAPRIRVLGSRHAFSDIADSDELVTLSGLDEDVAVDRDALTVCVGGGVRYDNLAQRLADEGLALANLASLPHISVAGAIATATHGSGDANGNLATAVRGLEIMTSDGSLRRIATGDPDFDGAVVGLGALGAVTRITLAVEPAYEVAQQAFLGLPWSALFEHFDAITASGYSVSVFTRWQPDTAEQVWVKNRLPGPPLAQELFGAPAASEEMHPIAGLDPVNCTPQLGSPGPWFDRLPHFRIGFTPSAGEEIQSEYIVPRTHAIPAIEALLRLGATISPLVQVSELRTVAADRLWLSPQYERDSVAIHFTWKPDQQEVERALRHVERALEPFDPRPHWGKLFLADAATIGARYERLRDFASLAERLDPRGAFRNRWLEEHVLGAG
jgi:xylitol oxidase